MSTLTENMTRGEEQSATSSWPASGPRAAAAEPDSFVQEAPRPPANRWLADHALRLTVTRLAAESQADHGAAGAGPLAGLSQMLSDAGARAEAELAPLAAQAERNAPVLAQYDAWGRRIDRIEVSGAWLDLVRRAQELGAVALAYERPFGAASRIAQAALLQLINPVSATALCPLSMTDGAVAALSRFDPALAAEWVPRLTARAGGWTAAQWMTEKEGGSDVGRSATAAIPAGSAWALYGTKWFTSATTADVALALARPRGASPGSRGLSLFALRLRRDDGTWNGLRIRRLKDKLGTRALPTAEMDLDGTLAVPVGGLERGVPKVTAVLHSARLWAAQAATGDVGYLLALARDYATRREVAGGLLASQPVHQRWLAEIAAVYQAMLQLTLRAAQIVGHDDVSSGGTPSPLARVVVPLAKLAAARQGVWAASQLLESFGGAGYLEDTGLPRLLRDVHVHSIWEGTTNVLALDVLRALRDPASGAALLADIAAQLGRYGEQGIAGDAERAVRAVLPELEHMIADHDPAQARRLAWGLARTYQTVLMIAHARWAATTRGDTRPAITAAMFAGRRPLLDHVPAASASDLADLAFGRAAGE
ncbi:MAG: acyl-CoA dehydrogenase family protein [Streptosporangiaceae bacterium]